MREINKRQQLSRLLLSMELHHQCSMVFHDVEYLMSLEVDNDGDSLVIEVEDKSSGEQWRAHFSSRCASLQLCGAAAHSVGAVGADIEEITHKTGNFKKFSVFLKMLVSSLSPAGSDTVFVDLLTYNDLEMLKNRKSSARKQSSSSGVKPNNKRYLILTYAVEFDRSLCTNDAKRALRVRVCRVHYPLPLQFVDQPDSEALQKTIHRLRSELAERDNCEPKSEQQVVWWLVSGTVV